MGYISTRGWVLKNTPGGDGVQVRITRNGSQIWPTSSGPLSLGANNQTGQATNVDLNVAAGDVIRFEVNNGGGGDATNDVTSWAPSIGYVLAACATQNFCNSSFETPSVGSGYQYNPSVTAATWNFTGSSGVAGNNSGFTQASPPAPNGSQVAFLQQTGSFTQSVNLPNATKYTIIFQAAQRIGGSNGTGVDNQDFQVYVDVTLLGTFKPGSSSYQSFSANSFYTGGGNHTIKFVGLNTAGGDNTALIDNVQIVIG
jgi:hypothetical protein